MGRTVAIVVAAAVVGGLVGASVGIAVGGGHPTGAATKPQPVVGTNTSAVRSTARASARRWSAPTHDRKPGGQFRLTVVRGWQTRTVEVTLRNVPG